MHDGRFATLRDVVEHYDHGVQASPNLAPALIDGGGAPRRLNLSEADKLALLAFLGTLTDNALMQDAKFSNPF
jgi:cytochrome c peroxidase